MKGTVKQLLEQGVTCNGCKLTGADISVLVRLGVGQRIGSVPKPAGKRGKPEGIYHLETGQVVIGTL